MVESPRELLENALPALDRAASERRATGLSEADLQAALIAAAGKADVPLALKHWPAIGPSDVVLDGDVGIELRWCISGDGLAGCAWDIAKLAATIAEHQLSAGWILAAAPSWHWDTRRPGVELFREHAYMGEELVEDYEDWWRLWCNELMSRPTHLPRAMALTDVGELSGRIGHVPFTFRYARVEVRASTWYPHVCPHHWRNRFCLPRPWDPEGTGEIVVVRRRELKGAEANRVLAPWAS